MVKVGFRSSHCGAMGLAASLERWFTGLSLAQHSGLRIQHCHNCSSDLIPGLGTQHAVGWPQTKKKEKRWILAECSKYFKMRLWFTDSGINVIPRPGDSGKKNKLVL